MLRCPLSLTLSPQTPLVHPEASWGARILDRLARAQPRPDDRIFFLLYPPWPVAERIRRVAVRFCRRFCLPGDPTAIELLHVSLLGLCTFGQLTGRRLDAVAEALARLTMPCFLLEFDRVMHFGREQGPLVLCGDEDNLVGLRMLQRELVDAIRPIASPQRPLRFTPHVTLNYRKCSMPEEAEAVEAIRWQAADIALVCSLYGRHRHIELGRWPLASRPQRIATAVN